MSGEAPADGLRARTVGLLKRCGPEDDEHVGLCAEFPSLSWLSKTPEAALKGIRRVVSEVRYIQHFDNDGGYVVTDEWFQPDRDNRAVRNPHAPIPIRLLDELVAHGYDPSLHDLRGAA